MIVLRTGNVSRIVSCVGGTIIMITVVSQILVLVSHLITHNVSLPTETETVESRLMAIHVVPGTTVAITNGVVVCVHLSTVTVVIVIPTGCLVQIVSVPHVSQIVLIIVSIFGVLLKITVDVSQMFFTVSHTTTHIVSKL